MNEIQYWIFLSGLNLDDFIFLGACLIAITYLWQIKRLLRKLLESCNE